MTSSLLSKEQRSESQLDFDRKPLEAAFSINQQQSEGLTAASSNQRILSSLASDIAPQDSDDFIAEASSGTTEYKTTPWRWLVLAGVFLSTVCQTMTVMSIAPVAVPVQEAFQLNSSIAVNMCAMSFSLCGVPMTFVAVWAFSKFSTNFVLRTATTLQFAGAMFRMISIPTGYFWPVLFGTMLQACAAPFIINCQMVICNKWFSDKERALAMSLLTLSMPLGSALAFALTGYYFRDTTGDNKDCLNNLLVTQAWIFIAVYTFFQLVFRDKPQHPPSAVATAPVQNLRFCEAFGVMKQNTPFMLLVMSFALMFGFYVALGNLISSIFSPFNMEAQEIAMVGLYLLAAGVLGAILIGAFVDRTGFYKMTTLVLGVANMVFLGILNQTLYHIDQSQTRFLIATCLMGFTSVAYIPLSLGFSAELTFPLQPALVNGSMILAGQASAAVQSILFAFVLDVNAYDNEGVPVPEDQLNHMKQDRAWWTIFCFMIITGMSFLISLFIKEDLKRLRFGKKSEAAADAGSDKGGTGQGADFQNEDGYKKLSE